MCSHYDIVLAVSVLVPRRSRSEGVHLTIAVTATHGVIVAGSLSRSRETAQLQRVCEREGGGGEREGER